jgi:hypothetical protein
MQITKLIAKYPNMVIRATCDDPNAIHQWCWFKEIVLDDDDYYRNHFSLSVENKREFEELFHIRM